VDRARARAPRPRRHGLRAVHAGQRPLRLRRRHAPPPLLARRRGVVRAELTPGARALARPRSRDRPEAVRADRRCLVRHGRERLLARLGVATETLSPEDARRLYPSVGGPDLQSVLYEPGAGVLYARTATRALARNLAIQIARPTPAEPPDEDVVVWACGSWLP